MILHNMIVTNDLTSHVQRMLTSKLVDKTSGCIARIKVNATQSNLIELRLSVTDTKVTHAALILIVMVMSSTMSVLTGYIKIRANQKGSNVAIKVIASNYFYKNWDQINQCSMLNVMAKEDSHVHLIQIVIKLDKINVPNGITIKAFIKGNFVFKTLPFLFTLCIVFRWVLKFIEVEKLDEQCSQLNNFSWL